MLSEIIGAHRAAVDAVRSALTDDPAEQPDDIWTVRFVLSAKGNVARAAARARNALAFRQTHRDVLSFAEADVPYPNHHRLEELLVQDVRIVKGVPRLFVHGGRSNLYELHEEFSQEQIVNYILYTKERCHVLADKESRCTDRLVKMVTVVDLEGFEWARFDRRFLRSLARADAASEPCYPQLLGAATIVNAPRVLETLWSIAQSILPAATCEKVSLVADPSVLELL
tara:strand:+ start:577 stop:1257 length:681 start_codon:yes stop_codon:yes gene_type:complete